MNIINRFKFVQRNILNLNQKYNGGLLISSQSISNNRFINVIENNLNNNNIYRYNQVRFYTKEAKPEASEMTESEDNEDQDKYDEYDQFTEDIDEEGEKPKKKEISLEEDLLSASRNMLLEKNIKEISQKITKFYTPQAETINIESQVGQNQKFTNLQKIIDLNNQAENFLQRGDWKEAEPILTGAISYFKKNLMIHDQSYHDGITTKQVYGYLLGNLGLVYHNLEFQGDAKLLYLEAIKNLKSESDQFYYGYTLLNLAELSSLLNSNELAIDYTTQAIEIFEKIQNQITDERLNLAYFNLSSYYCQDGKFQEALPFCLKSFKSLEKNLGRESEIVQTVAINLSKIYQQLNMTSELEALDKEFQENPQGGLQFKTNEKDDLSHIDLNKLAHQWSEKGHQKHFDVDGFYKSHKTARKEFQSFFKQLKENGVLVGSEIQDLVKSELESLDYAPDKLSQWKPATITVNKDEVKVIDRPSIL
ncbi:hypothetical protein DLAC_10739 [Tieghemostelium lacteum]|uniref:Tetratricopeptide repeat protein n=1 Tax=Tieghemostelium lacteum TaxID=361077 RepID=A0A151Z432_TIELA|nr:hypothetical protein DLAC_10739 [Tieghemostelium lacteum]|eukprot:KYQ88716.1 hypothetical protein DLAC_10739 [Tieghemostelium lacteum]